MAEKISMIIVVVDLDCHKCYNKIRKILCQLQDCERILTISFDDKSKTITIAGPFDPHRLACKLRCKGGKVIRDIHIVDSGGGGGKPPPQKMAEAPPSPSPSPAPAKNGKPPKHKEKPAPAAAEPPPPPTPPPEPAPAPPPDMPPPSPAHQAPGMSAMVPAFVEEKQPRARPAELEPPPMSPPRKERPPPPMDLPSPMMPASMPPPVKERSPPPRPPCRPLENAPVVEYVIPTVEIPSWPAPPVGPCGCPCCAPCYQGYYEGCRCCCCGRTYAQPLPPPAGCGYRGCRTFSDEDPTAACSIM